MAASNALVHAIRALLRARGMTYRDLAGRVGVSEPTIKRDLGGGNFSLERLDRMCAALDIGLEDLLQAALAGGPGHTPLTDAQERALVADPKLLMTTYLLVNGWQFDDIMAVFQLDENGLVQQLLALDALRVIAFRPPRRVKLLTARNFTWRRDGPVHAYFVQRVMPEFLGDAFAGKDDGFHFVGALLSASSRMRLEASMARLAAEFEQLARDDAALPLSERDASAAVFALRKWEFSAFTELRRAGT